MKRPALKAATVLLALGSACTVMAEVTVDSAWIRAMPPTQRMTAGYATLVNDGERAVTVTGASSPVASIAELHTTEQQGDSMRMVPLGPVTVAPGESFSLAPGGPHVMLMGVQNMPAEGAHAQLCFTLGDGETVCATAVVQRKASDSTGNSHHQH